ncbi:MAG: HAMP domain-containing protein, partial [Bacteroidota bacterium]
EMGMNSRSGKKVEMRQHADEVTDLMKILLSKIENNVGQIKTQQYYSLSLVLGFCIILSILLSYYLAAVITRPIYRLNVAIQHIIARDFKGELEIIHNNAQDEVGELTRNFNAMLKELQSRLKEEKKAKKLK